jgi:hypothetical protein
MPLINAETKIPQLLADYVDSRRTALAIPAATALPFFAGVSGGSKKFPCVVFHCPDFDMSQHPERMKLNVEVAYEESASTAESETENATTAKIRSALADLASWNAYIDGLTSGERTGWLIRGTRLMSGGTEINADRQTRRRFTQIEVRVMSSETVFPAA